GHDEPGKRVLAPDFARANRLTPAIQNNSDPAQGPPRRPVTASSLEHCPDQRHRRDGRAEGRAAPVQMQQVHYFLALCEELSFTRAARRCGISQPSLTSAIGALERELGGALFQRKPSIALTGLGRIVRPYLDEIVRNASHAREIARSFMPRVDAIES
ncbi:MAG TPA: LysR family transcriptional regulator, partial [Xanthobacteraceae bacterium]|nr:LysR family transcriptional regulator [Xanthobacteraceae bacterium]